MADAVLDSSRQSAEILLQAQGRCELSQMAKCCLLGGGVDSRVNREGVHGSRGEKNAGTQVEAVDGGVCAPRSQRNVGVSTQQSRRH